MTEYVSAQPGDCILIRDEEAAHGFVSVPVVAYTFVDGKIAFPVTPMATGGLVKAARALLTGGMVIDRGFAIPFDGPAEWLAWAATVEPDEHEEPAVESLDPLDKSMGNDTQRGNETAEQTRARLLRENANTPHTDVTGSARRSSTRKTFASKSFWSRTRTDGVTEVATIEPGWGLPLDHEGWEKIKRDDFANYKRDAKNGESVVVREWSEKDGVIEAGSAAEAEQSALDADVEDLI